MNDVAGHYSRLASSYDRLWTVDEHFVEDTAAAIVTALDLQAGDRFVDLGGGTGLHAAAIAARTGFTRPPLVVDPSPDLLAQVPPGILRTREDDAAGFARRPEPFDKLLMKEMIHHLEPGSGGRCSRSLRRPSPRAAGCSWSCCRSASTIRCSPRRWRASRRSSPTRARWPPSWPRPGSR